MGCCVWGQIKEIKVLDVLQSGRKSAVAWVADSGSVARGLRGRSG